MSTEATTQFSTEVEFRKKSSEDKPSIAHVEEVTEKETSLEVFKYEEKSENILSAHAMNIADNEHASEERSQSNKGCGFYASISGGKVYSDSSELFVSGIKAIGDRIINLIKEDHYINIIIKTVATKQFENIKQFNGKVDFQWLGSASLGYYAAENGRVDFEVMYSKVNIKDSNATPIFDKSAGIFTFLLNFYYNPRIQNTKFAPYAGLGIGPTVFRLKKVNEPNKDLMPLNVPWFAYQVKLGVDYSIIPEIKTFLGYRYFSIPIALADDIATHNIEVGLLFNF
nr:P44/Msp2 family outer membrane protein [Wolbachia endosymbiont of Folsomia candida]